MELWCAPHSTWFACSMWWFIAQINNAWPIYIEEWTFERFEEKHWIKKELPFCIAWADSDFWRQLKSKNNIWNVWNNDRWDTVAYETIDDGIEAIFKTLNWTYLKHKQSVWSLSPGGWWDPSYYATSPENWNNNVLNCLNTILDTKINEDWNFRI